ncbi:MAG TPA: sensor domain-containing protein [Pseudonocardiaceae bacterium]|jgi:signal transduction histidine kinase|nr:sensor domain-containing protein [Pseudonocardiaceae bacterium]
MRSPVARPGLGGSLAYLSLSLFNGVFWFCLLFPFTMAGIGTAIVWLGVPLLMLVTMLWRGAATVERRWLRATLGVDIPSPYRPLPDKRALGRWRAKIADPATWRDIAYVVIRLPLSVIEFSITVALWSVPLSLIALPIVIAVLPAGSTSLVLPNLRGGVIDIDTVGAALPFAVFAIPLLFLIMKLTMRIAQLHAVIASALLCPTRMSELSAKAEHLQSSRARGVDAAEAERRRIERDLHDGAQQRLVAVAMTLGRAKNKLTGDDPNALAELIEEAHADAKLAVSELRDLARGIYPAVLGDRGLDAALSALAARSPIPVDVQVTVDPRPPAAVESTAYFIVGESLTNIAKHSDAKHVQVKVNRGEDSVVVEVTDDGKGGAELRPGGGLAGLADRAATIDGVITVFSPLGGPTVVRADLPCAW